MVVELRKDSQELELQHRHNTQNIVQLTSKRVCTQEQPLTLTDIHKTKITSTTDVHRLGTL